MSAAVPCAVSGGVLCESRAELLFMAARATSAGKSRDRPADVRRGTLLRVVRPRQEHPTISSLAATASGISARAASRGSGVAGGHRDCIFRVIHRFLCRAVPTAHEPEREGEALGRVVDAV